MFMLDSFNLDLNYEDKRIKEEIVEHGTIFIE